MEERAKFTVFKIKVEKSESDSWFVFRRYTDFVQLNEKLRRKFPKVRLSLPPKRWFKDNFDKDFIEDRVLGLQAFINNCIGHKDICNSRPVREFFCFDEPPGPHDSLEESRVCIYNSQMIGLHSHIASWSLDSLEECRALCDNLEESVYRLRKEVSEKDTEISLLREELDLYKRQVEMLSQALRYEGINNN
ncbi:hypothetical protein FSP39_023207 [Pinctada imbricata]|uniref:PX domain-containing protein n=1 Tax=Pinctada imbricata TaxID=66713 RepID=A0AA88XJD4_PINIB|nr:hypothetical protein FSP39_023207 [Pinctada imbricata]